MQRTVFIFRTKEFKKLEYLTLILKATPTRSGGKYLQSIHNSMGHVFLRSYLQNTQLKTEEIVKVKGRRGRRQAATG